MAGRWCSSFAIILDLIVRRGDDDGLVMGRMLIALAMMQRRRKNYLMQLRRKSVKDVTSMARWLDDGVAPLR